MFDYLASIYAEQIKQAPDVETAALVMEDARDELDPEQIATLEDEFRSFEQSKR